MCLDLIKLLQINHITNACCRTVITRVFLCVATPLSHKKIRYIPAANAGCYVALTNPIAEEKINE